MRARDEGAKGLVEGDVAVAADAGEEEVDGAVGEDEGFVAGMVGVGMSWFEEGFKERGGMVGVL